MTHPNAALYGLFAAILFLAFVAGAAGWMKVVGVVL